MAERSHDEIESRAREDEFQLPQFAIAEPFAGMSDPFDVQGSFSEPFIESGMSACTSEEPRTPRKRRKREVSKRASNVPIVF